MSTLLHTEAFDRIPIVGRSMAENLEQRARETAAGALGQADPRISIVIRARNNIAKLEGLFADIAAQAFDGEAEVVVVDNESTDGTARHARKLGATVVNIARDDFSHPKALNLAFEAAGHDWVFTFVDHSNLSNSQIFRAITRWQRHPNLGGVYGTSLPNTNATWTERLGALILNVDKTLATPAAPTTKPVMGTLATNCAVINRDAWQDVGKFDEAYGAGGEDGAMARSLIGHGYGLIMDPTVSILHTHGLGPLNGWRQLQRWKQTEHPTPFDRKFIDKYRPDIT